MPVSHYPNTPIPQHPSTPLSQYPNTPPSQYSCIPIPHYPTIPLSQYPIIPISQYPIIPLSQYPSAPLPQYSCIPISQYPSIHLSQYPPIPLPHYPSIPSSRYPIIPPSQYPVPVAPSRPCPGEGSCAASGPPCQDALHKSGRGGAVRPPHSPPKPPKTHPGVREGGQGPPTHPASAQPGPWRWAAAAGSREHPRGAAERGATAGQSAGLGGCTPFFGGAGGSRQRPPHLVGHPERGPGAAGVAGGHEGLQERGFGGQLGAGEVGVTLGGAVGAVPAQRGHPAGGGQRGGTHLGENHKLRVAGFWEWL